VFAGLPPKSKPEHEVRKKATNTNDMATNSHSLHPGRCTTKDDSRDTIIKGLLTTPSPAQKELRKTISALVYTTRKRLPISKLSFGTKRRLYSI
jgi:hypothetical protein